MEGRADLGVEVARRATSPEERDGWRQLGDDPIVAVLKPAEAADPTIELAARGEHRDLLGGPFMLSPPDAPQQAPSPVNGRGTHQEQGREENHNQDP